MDALRFLTEDIPAKGLQIRVEVPLALLQPKDVEPLPVETVLVTGLLREAGGEYLLQGVLSGMITQACDRCLVPLSLPFEVELAWIFEEGAALGGEEEGAEFSDEDLDEADTVFRFQNGAIDLTAHVWEEAALAMPSKFVCDLSDTSTCPFYNAPRDATSGEDGGDTAPESQFAGLKDLLPELRQESPEE